MHKYLLPTFLFTVLINILDCAYKKKNVPESQGSIKFATTFTRLASQLIGIIAIFDYKNLNLREHVIVIIVIFNLSHFSSH